MRIGFITHRFLAVLEESLRYNVASLLSFRLIQKLMFCLWA